MTDGTHISVAETALRVEPHVRVRLDERLAAPDGALTRLQFAIHISKISDTNGDSSSCLSMPNFTSLLHISMLTIDVVN